MSTDGGDKSAAATAPAKEEGSSASGSSLKPPPITTTTAATANGSASTASTPSSLSSSTAAGGATPKKSLSAAAPAFKPSKLRAVASEFVPGGGFKPSTSPAGGPSLLAARGASPSHPQPPSASGGPAKPPRGAPSSPSGAAPRPSPNKGGPPPYGMPKGAHPMGGMHYGGGPGMQYMPPGQQPPMPYHPGYPPPQHYHPHAHAPPPHAGGPGGAHGGLPNHGGKGKGPKQGQQQGQQQQHQQQQQQGQEKGGEAAAGGKQQQANGAAQKPPPQQQQAQPTAGATPDSKTKAADSSAAAAKPQQQPPQQNGQAAEAATAKADAAKAPAPASAEAPKEREKEKGNDKEGTGPGAAAPAPAPAPWRRTSGAGASGGPVAPVPVKASAAAASRAAGTAAEWEEVINSLPAVPDAPQVAGVAQYHARDLLQIRRAVVEALPPGPPPKPEGCGDIPAEILNTEPPGASPIPQPAPSPAPEPPGAGGGPPRSRTPKVAGPDGLPRPRSTNMGLDDASGSGGRGSSSGGRNTPRGEGGDAPPSFGRQKSAGKKGARGRGGFRDGTPPPLEDADGYAPKRIAEEMRWRPESIALRRGGGVDPEDPEKKIKRARAILNKLSLEKFDKLSAEFINVGFTSDVLLWRAIDIIVAKAQEEVHFSSMYAELCLRLSRTPFEGLGEEGKGKLFRKALLVTCQEEFEKTLEQRVAEVEADAAVPAEEKAEKKRIAKFRYLGHMRFIGELFLKELLKEEVVHECIKYLFGEEDAPDEEGLECLCKLLGTTGKKLELLAAANTDASAGKKQRKQMQRYFDEVRKLSASKELLSSRTRCLLKDLWELRQNDYVPRRAVETAKTLSQVHEEIAREEQAKAKQGGGGGGGAPRLGSRTSSSSRLSGSDAGGGGGGSQDVRREGSSSGLSRQNSSASLSGQGAGPAVDDDGWETVGPKKPSGLGKSASRVSLARSGSNASLGGGGGGGGAGGMKKTGSASSFGAFAALQERERRDKKDKKDKDKEKKEKKSDKGQQQPAQPKDRPPRLATDASQVDAAAADNGPASAASTPAATPKAGASASAALPADEKEVMRKGRSILADFFETRDAKDAAEAMAELGALGDALAGRLVGAWLEDALQRKGEQMAMLADLLVALHGAELLPSGPIASGLAPTLEGLADLRVDVPKLEEWLAAALARMVEGGALSLAVLKAPPPQMVEDGCAAPFVAKVVEQLKARVGGEKAKGMVEAAGGIDWAALVGPDAEDPAAEAAALVERLAL